MSLMPPPDVTVPVSVASDTITVAVPGDDELITVATTAAAPDVVIVVPAGTVVTGGGGPTPPPATTVVSGDLPDNEIIMLGADDDLGAAPETAATSTGHRIHTHEVLMEFEPGTGPFFSQILPDGTVALPQLPLSISQVASTGRSLAMSFWSPREGAFYTVKVPTTLGETDVVTPGDTVGGADMSDCCVVTFDTIYGPEVILYGLSAIPYRHWNVTAHGEWPVLAAFKLNRTTGRWVYHSARSIFPADLQSSPSGTLAWPTQANSFGQNVVRTLLPCECVTLPRSGHIALSVYAPRSGQRSGSVAVIDADAKDMTAWYEFPNMVSPSGGLLDAYPRDINADPTSDVNDERILINFDTFRQPNETWNAVVWADSGTWRLSWGGVFTAAIPLGAGPDEVQAALEAIAAIGAGNVTVRMHRPFLLNIYTIYEIELIGARARTNYSGTAATIDTASLVNNQGSAVTRWKTGGTTVDDQTWFPLVEMAYNASTGALTPVTAPMIPLDAIDSPTPESIDATFGMGWYGQDGTAWGMVTGLSDNPDLSTVFTFRGLHGWRKDPVTGERRWVTENAPASGWQNTVGSSRPVPDVMTDGVHGAGGQFPLALAEDHHTRAVIAATVGGRLKFAVPTEGLARRSGNMLVDTQPIDWTALGGHTGVWDATEGAFKLTAASTTDLEANSPYGTAGVIVPASMEGSLIQLELDVRAAATGRLTYPVVRFYDTTGAEIAALTGWGPASRITTTTYRTLIGSVKIPAGCRYMAAGISINGNANGEIHYVRRAELFVPAALCPPDVDTGAYLLFDGAPGASWLAKGFVDPKTRHLWLPYLQSLSQAAAKMTRYPSWLVRVDMGKILTAEVIGE